MSLGYTPEVPMPAPKRVRISPFITMRELTPAQVEASERATESAWASWERNTGQTRPEDYRKRARPAPPSVRVFAKPRDQSQNSGFVDIQYHYKGQEPVRRSLIKSGDEVWDESKGEPTPLRLRHDKYEQMLDNFDEFTACHTGVHVPG